MPLFANEGSVGPPATGTEHSSVDAERWPAEHTYPAIRTPLTLEEDAGSLRTVALRATGLTAPDTEWLRRGRARE
jgi:hypothetical protein